MTHFFITGTDTEVGKTFVTVRLLNHLQQLGDGRSAVGYKPVSAGAAPNNPDANEDALLLAAASEPSLPVNTVNPVFYKTPAAPLFAAARENAPYFDCATAKQHVAQLAGRYDHVIVEGAGGWFAPVAPGETVEGLAQAIDLPVILVVGLRLGCLNHALLTEAAIARSGVPYAGWVASNVGGLHGRDLEDHLQYLEEHMGAPCLGYVDAERSVFPHALLQ